MPRFTDIKKERYLEALRGGMWRTASADEVGVHYSTVRRHILKDAEFALAVDEAEIDANTRVETALYLRAVDGNVTAALAWLYSRMPERWQDMRRASTPRPRDVSMPSAVTLTPEKKEKLMELVDELRDAM